MAEPNIRTNPYPGPVSFQIGETLYGRPRETRQLLNLLIAERIVLLYSPSGAGKTSLIQAALIPELAQEGFRVFRPARVSLGAEEQVSGIANRYIFSLLLSWEAHLPDARAPLPHSDLAAMTLAEYLALRTPHHAPTPDEPADAPVAAEPWADEWHGDVLIFDQFEEILTVDPTDRDAKQEFFRQVGEVLQDRQRWVLFAMREEFLAGLDPYLRAIPTRFATTFRLELLGPDAARQAMQKPAAAQGVTFTDTAADKLINDLRTVQVMETDGSTHAALGDFVEPVQLQVVCLRLWQGLAADDDAIGVDDVDAFGDVDSALRAYYTATVDRVALATDVGGRLLREWVSAQLITESGIRGQVLMGQNRTVGLQNVAIWQLVDAHLVRAEKRRGATWFELAHDRLLAPVQGENEAWFAHNLTPFQRQAAAWDKAGRLEGLVLHGTELYALIEQFPTLPKGWTETEEAFYAACRAAWARAEQDARQRRRIRWLAIGASVVALIALITATWGWFASVSAQRERATAEAESVRANEQANLAFTRQLLAQADQVYDENPLLGLRLALEADAHFTQADPKLQTQIISQTHGYLAQGRIATLATDAIGFIDVPGTPWLIVKRSAGSGADELRRKADGSLVRTLAGSMGWGRVYTISASSPFFVVDYQGETPDELRSKADGSLISPLTGPVSGIYPISDGPPFFVVNYDGDTPGELRSKADGSLVRTLTGPVSGVYPISDGSPFFVVNYDDTSGELRSKADGLLVSPLAGSMGWGGVYPISDGSPFFVVGYDGDTPGELRSKADGSLVSPLAGPVSGVYPISDGPPFFVVDYDGDTPGELRSKADGSLVSPLTGPMSGVYPLSDGSPLFVVHYDDTSGELRSKADGSLVRTLAGSIAWNGVYTISASSPFFVVDYQGETPDELRSKADGSLISPLTGPVSGVYPISDGPPFFVVDYDGDTPGELRSKADGSLVRTLAGPVSRVYPISDGSPFFVVHYRDYRDDTSGELRSKADGSLVSPLTGPVSGVDPISDGSPFFMVGYDGDTPGELRSKADGSLVSRLAGPLLWNGDYPISANSPFFVVRYWGAPYELRNKADGSFITGLVKSIEDDYYAVGYFFVERSDNRHTELWQLEPLNRLADLGFGLPWEDNNRGVPIDLPADTLQFIDEQQTLALRYEDGRAYLLDLAWLAERAARIMVRSTDRSEMSALACLPFATRSFDESVLEQEDYLGTRPLRACQHQ